MMIKPQHPYTLPAAATVTEITQSREVGVYWDMAQGQDIFGEWLSMFCAAAKWDPAQSGVAQHPQLLWIRRHFILTNYWMVCNTGLCSFKRGWGHLCVLMYSICVHILLIKIINGVVKMYNYYNLHTHTKSILPIRSNSTTLHSTFSSLNKSFT